MPERNETADNLDKRISALEEIYDSHIHLKDGSIFWYDILNSLKTDIELNKKLAADVRSGNISVMIRKSMTKKYALAGEDKADLIIKMDKAKKDWEKVHIRKSFRNLMEDE